MHQVGNQLRLYYGARSTNHQVPNVILVIFPLLIFLVSHLPLRSFRLHTPKSSFGVLAKYTEKIHTKILYCFAVYINGRDTRNLTRGPKFSTKINIYRKWK